MTKIKYWILFGNRKVVFSKYPGLKVDAVQKQRQIDINNSYKKLRIVDSRYQKQKAKIKD